MNRARRAIAECLVRSLPRCRTKLENAHRTVVFRVLVYPWHPWFGIRVAIHEVVDKADGAVFRGTLSDLQ